MSKLIDKEEQNKLKETVHDTHSGLTGFVWCIMAGCCYGILNCFAKLAYNRGLPVSRLILMRFMMLGIGSYVYGRFVRKTSFDLKQYDKKQIRLVFFRAFISLTSKGLQYTAILFIPLSLSSCISFTTGPVFAAILAFILIKEKLKLNEVVPIICGIVGTMMITMP